MRNTINAITCVREIAAGFLREARDIKVFLPFPVFDDVCTITRNPSTGERQGPVGSGVDVSGKASGEEGLAGEEDGGSG